MNVNSLDLLKKMHKKGSPTIRCPEGISGCLVVHYSDQIYCMFCYVSYPCKTMESLEATSAEVENLCEAIATKIEEEHLEKCKSLCTVCSNKCTHISDAALARSFYK